MPTWRDTSLPLAFDRDSFDHALQDGVLKTSMEVGPPKRRRRVTASVEPLSGTMRLSTAQWQELDTFYNDTVQQAAEFDFPNPDDPDDPGEDIIVVFDGPPRRKYRAPGVWTVSLRFEVQP